MLIFLVHPFCDISGDYSLWWCEFWRSIIYRYHQCITVLFIFTASCSLFIWWVQVVCNSYQHLFCIDKFFDSIWSFFCQLSLCGFVIYTTVMIQCNSHIGADLLKSFNCSMVSFSAIPLYFIVLNCKNEPAIYIVI